MAGICLVKELATLLVSIFASTVQTGGEMKMAKKPVFTVQTPKNVFLKFLFLLNLDSHLSNLLFLNSEIINESRPKTSN